jgi:DNA polymerase
MFEQAVEVVLKALSGRSSAGAKPRASAESLGRLRAARPIGHANQLAAAFSPTITKSAAEFGHVESQGEAPVASRKRCTHCSLVVEGASLESGLLLPLSLGPGQLLLVGECGCSVKDAESASFGGASGQLLLKMLKTMGLGRDAVNLVNVIVCDSDSSGDDAPTAVSVRAESRAAFRDLVKRQPPRLIVAMGANAAASLFANEPGIELSRSTWRKFEGIPVMTTFHASHLIQNPAISERRKVWEDLMLVMEELGMDVSERQRSFFQK